MKLVSPSCVGTAVTTHRTSTSTSPQRPCPIRLRHDPDPAPLPRRHRRFRPQHHPGRRARARHPARPVQAAQAARGRTRLPAVRAQGPQPGGDHAGRQRVLAHARRMLAEAGNIRAYAANERGDGQGRLVLATTHTQARFVLPPVIARGEARLPAASACTCSRRATARCCEQLARGEADLALISTAGDAPAGGIAVPLYRWRRVVLVPRAHAAGQARTRADAGRTRRASAGQLRILHRAESSLAPRVRRSRAGAAAGDDRARRRPDQDLCARRPRRRAAGGDGGRRARGHRPASRCRRRRRCPNASPGRCCRANACCATTRWRCCARWRRSSTRATCGACWKATWSRTGRSRRLGWSIAPQPITVYGL